MKEFLRVEEHRTPFGRRARARVAASRRASRQPRWPPRAARRGAAGRVARTAAMRRLTRTADASHGLRLARHVAGERSHRAADFQRRKVTIREIDFDERAERARPRLRFSVWRRRAGAAPAVSFP